MLYRDTEISRQLAREHHAELKRDWEWVNPAARPDVVESRRRNLRYRFEWLRTRPRLAGQSHSGHAPSGQSL